MIILELVLLLQEDSTSNVSSWIGYIGERGERISESFIYYASSRKTFLIKPCCKVLMTTIQAYYKICMIPKIYKTG